MTMLGIMSDVHANLAALKQALAVFESSGVGPEAIRVCGDVVGYGREPNACCDLIRELGCVVVAGNHDHAVAGCCEYRETHSPEAVRDIDRTRSVITPENLAWLRGLPLTHSEGDLLFVHASPVEPETWPYLMPGRPLEGSGWQGIQTVFNRMEHALCFVGHSHIPKLFIEKGWYRIKVIEPSERTYRLERFRAVVNVGSVGVPRNRRQRAAVMIYDPCARELFIERFTLSRPGRSGPHLLDLSRASDC